MYFPFLHHGGHNDRQRNSSVTSGISDNNDNDNDLDSTEKLCIRKSCAVGAFMVLLTVSLVLISLYATLHGIHVQLIFNTFKVVGAFAGAYCILVTDAVCSTAAIFAVTAGHGHVPTLAIVWGIYC
jgi:hypothetical protein